MSIFHKHNFIESTHNKIMLYCSCGKTVSMHIHNWEEIGEVRNSWDNDNLAGKVLKCIGCGEMKKFEI